MDELRYVDQSGVKWTARLTENVVQVKRLQGRGMPEVVDITQAPKAIQDYVAQWLKSPSPMRLNQNEWPITPSLESALSLWVRDHLLPWLREDGLTLKDAVDELAVRSYNVRGPGHMGKINRITIDAN